jgi:glycosyltransferase A (GT-A) superfamily protein (DUF2064 family)
MTTTVVMLAKEPVPGRVKTRLQARFTPQQAARLATAALADTAAAIRELPVRPVLAYDGRPGTWQPRGFHPVRQVPGDLSHRIEAALHAGLYDLPVLLVGMDTPQLRPALREVSWDGADALLGLTEDGGYWAIGLRGFVPGCVAGVPMSTDHTGEAQLERLRSLGLRVRLLPRLRDVDTPADAAAVAAAAPGLRFSGVHRRLVAAEAAEHLAGDRVFDLALAGEHGGVASVDPASGAAPVALDHERWQQPADEVDRLVLSRCRGPALDIGCGPGRIVRALAERGIPALGVDTSPVAVALTAERGAAVLHRAVQRPLPGEGRWGTVLLMDGNLGIGGDPEALLRRCRDLVRDDGVVIVEVDADDRVDETTALAVFDDTGGWTDGVPWARAGSPACRAHARRAGLVVAEEWIAEGRRFLALRPETR